MARYTGTTFPRRASRLNSAKLGWQEVISNFSYPEINHAIPRETNWWETTRSLRPSFNCQSKIVNRQ